jgi:ketosteroid isomerase-like protein
MAEGNTELVRRIIAAFNKADVEAILALCDPEIEFDWSRRLLDPVVLHGHRGVRSFVEDQQEVFEKMQIDEPEEIVERGDQVVWIGLARFRGRSSGADVGAHGAQVWTIRDGKAVRFRFYQTREEALEAVEAERATARPAVDGEQA